MSANKTYIEINYFFTKSGGLDCASNLIVQILKSRALHSTKLLD